VSYIERPKKKRLFKAQFNSYLQHDICQLSGGGMLDLDPHICMYWCTAVQMISFIVRSCSKPLSLRDLCRSRGITTVTRFSWPSR